MNLSGRIEIPGRVEKGVVVLEGPATLPEGAAVRVCYAGSPAIHVSSRRKPVRLPLISTGKPGTLDLTNDRIAEILDKEDVESVKGPWIAPP
jgi:hypothetical protein